jgi:hypothetical protein
MAMFDVFFSHSSVDKPWVRKLVADLVTHYRVSVWLDEEQIRPGAPIVDALEQALDACGSVALVVSPESMASGWVKEEYHRAVVLAQHKARPLQLIPLLLRTAELPGFLANRSWVDFRDPAGYANNVRRLVWGITGEKPSRVLDLQSAAAPAAVAPAPNREAALIRLLTDAFDGSPYELLQWVRLYLGAEVFNSLPHDSSLSQLAFATAMAVQQRGLTNRRMFTSLLAKRPGRKDQIRDVARMYGIVDVDIDLGDFAI